jgi:UDP-N-acetyl-D-glucosamine dehydrogenase
MPQVVVTHVIHALNDRGIAVRGSKVVVVGVSYKPNVRDYRESPALEVIRHLQSWGAEVSYVDPLVPELPLDPAMTALPLTEELVSTSDALLIICDHDALDYELIARSSRLVVDTRNALGRRGIRSPNVVLP